MIENEPSITSYPRQASDVANAGFAVDRARQRPKQPADSLNKVDLQG
jgi:hypothetical protein